MNQHVIRGTIAFLAAVTMVATGCQSHSDTHHADHPATVEHVNGSDLARVTLTEKAIERIDLRTSKVEDEADAETSVPYSALLYDAHGGTWVYTSPEPRTFVRHAVMVDRIEGDKVMLSSGPPAGTEIASVAVAELYGTEFEVGH